jgi:hypothetical protein
MVVILSGSEQDTKFDPALKVDSAGVVNGRRQTGRQWYNFSFRWGERPREPDTARRSFAEAASARQNEATTARQQPRPTKLTRCPAGGYGNCNR